MTELLVPTPLEYSGRRALIVGLGESGSAIARWLSFKGAALRLSDTRQNPPDLTQLREALKTLHAQFHRTTELEVKLGEFSAELLDGIDVVAWSPGLSIEVGESAKFYQLIVERGISIIGELDLFAQALSDLKGASDYRPEVIAVTGTNGKTTTVRLVHHLAQAAGKRVRVAGNISPSFLDALFDALVHDDLPEIWALELSSFQLALSTSFNPSVACVLNVSQNHLDWHASEQSYIQAKQKIFGSEKPANTLQDESAVLSVVVNRGQLSRYINEHAGDPHDSKPALPRARTFSFGIDQPTNVGDFGLVRDGGLMWLAHAVNEDGSPLPELPARGTKPRGKKQVVPQEIVVKRLMPADALMIRGRHNQMNALAALAMCTSIGIPMAAMLHGLRSFAGEPHRCQLVALVNDIEYYNDSKATTIAATVAALSGLDKPSVLIAGGKGKGQDFSALAQPVAEHARAVFLIGVDAVQIKDALQSTGVSVELCDTLERAVQRAQQTVKVGEVVLLSPACASLDMFSSYVARGDAFVTAVEALQ